MRVIAAIDESAAAGPILGAAGAIAEFLGATLEAVHVREDGGEVAQAEAKAAGVELRMLEGPTVASLVAAAGADDVAMMVLGVRGTPAGRRPGGRTALEVLTSLEKPVVVVPPDAQPEPRLRRILVPLDGTRATSGALDATIRLARSRDIDLVVLHVHDEDSLPLFADQPHHEAEAWEREFLARCCSGCPPKELTLQVCVGAPAGHVLRVAAESEVDLIALSWAQDLSPGRAAVVREVLVRTSIPILLVPLGEASGRSGRLHEGRIEAGKV